MKQTMQRSSEGMTDHETDQTDLIAKWRAGAKRGRQTAALNYASDPVLFEGLRVLDECANELEAALPAVHAEKVNDELIKALKWALGTVAKLVNVDGDYGTFVRGVEIVGFQAEYRKAQQTADRASIKHAEEAQ